MRIFIIFYPILAALVFVSSTSIEISSAPITVPDPESLINSISCAIFDVYQSAIVALHKHISEVQEATTDHIETVGNEISRGTRFMFDAVRPDVNLVFGNFKTALKKLADTLKEASNLGQIELEPAQVVWNELKHGIRRLKRYMPLIRAYMNKSLVEIEKNFENGTEQFNEAMNDLYTKVSNKLCYEVRSATKMLQHALSKPSVKYYDIDLEDVYQNWTQLLQPAKEIPINFFNAAKNLINLIYNNIQTKFFLSGILSENSLWPSSSVVWGDAVQVKRFVDNSLKRLESFIKTSVAQIRTKFGKDSAALSEANQSLYNQIYNEVKHLIDLTEIPFKRIFNLIGEQPPFSTVHVTDPTYDGRFEELLKYLQAKGYPVQIGLVECINLVSHSDTDDTHSQAEDFFDYLLEDTFKNSSPSEVISLYTNILQEERIQEVTNIYRRLFYVVQKCAGTALEDGYKLPKLISMKIEDDAYKYTLLVNDIRAYISKSACFIEEYYSPTSEEYQNAINNLCEDIKHKLDIAADYTLDSIKRLNNYLENHGSCLERFTLWTDSCPEDGVTLVSDNEEGNELKIVHGPTSISGTDNIEKVGCKDVKASNLEGKSENLNSDTVTITAGTLDTEITTSKVDVLKTESKSYNSEDTHTATTGLNLGLRENEKQEEGQPHNIEELISPRSRLTTDIELGVSSEEASDEETAYTEESATVQHIAQNSYTSRKTHEEQSIAQESILEASMRNLDDADIITSRENTGTKLENSVKANQIEVQSCNSLTVDQNLHENNNESQTFSKYSSSIDGSEQQDETDEDILQRINECDSHTENFISHNEMSNVESKAHEDTTFSTTKTDSVVLNGAAGDHEHIISSTSVNDETSLAMKIEEISTHTANTVVDSNLIINDDALDTNSNDDISSEKVLGLKVQDNMIYNAISAKSVVNQASGSSTQLAVDVQADNCDHSSNGIDSDVPLLDDECGEELAGKETTSTSSVKNIERTVQVKSNSLITEHHNKECTHKNLIPSEVAGEVDGAMMKSPTHDFEREIEVEHERGLSHAQTEIMREQNELKTVIEGSECSTNMEHEVVVDGTGHEKIITSSLNHDFSAITEVGHEGKKNDVISLDIDDLRKNGKEGIEMSDSALGDILKTSEESSQIKESLYEQNAAENIEERISHDHKIIKNVVTSSSNNDLSSFTNLYSSNNMKESSEEGLSGSAISDDTINENVPVCKSLVHLESSETNDREIPKKKYLTADNSNTEDHIIVQSENHVCYGQSLDVSENVEEKDAVHQDLTVHSSNNLSVVQSSSVSENIEENDKKYVSRSIIDSERDIPSNGDLNFETGSDVLVNTTVESHVKENTEISHDSKTDYERTVVALKNTRTSSSEDCKNSEKITERNGLLAEETSFHNVVSHSSSDSIVENHSKICEAVDSSKEKFDDSDEKKNVIAQCLNSKLSTESEREENIQVDASGTMFEGKTNEKIPNLFSSDDLNILKKSGLCGNNEECHQENTGECCHTIDNVVDKTVLPNDNDDSYDVGCVRGSHSTHNVINEEFGVESNDGISVMSCRSLHADSGISNENSIIARQAHVHEIETNVVEHELCNSEQNNVSLLGESHSESTVEISSRLEEKVEETSMKNAVLQAEREICGEEIVTDESILNSEVSTLNDLQKLEDKMESPAATLNVKCDTNNSVLDVDDDSRIASAEDHIKTKILKEGEHIVERNLKEEKEIFTKMTEETCQTETAIDDKTISNIEDENVTMFETARSSTMTKQESEKSALKEYTSEGKIQSLETDDISSEHMTSGLELKNTSHENDVEHITLQDESSTTHDISTTLKTTVVKNEINMDKTDISAEEFSRMSQLKTDDATLMTTSGESSTVTKVEYSNNINNNDDDYDDASNNGPLYHMIWFPKKSWKSVSPPPTTSVSGDDDDHSWLGWLLPGKRPILDTNPENLPDALGRVYDRIRGTRTSTSDKQLETPMTENIGITEQSNDYTSSKIETTQSSFTKSSSHSSSTDVQASETDISCDEDERNSVLAMKSPITLEHEEPIFYKKWYNSLIKTK